jgi:hypothetical protein
MTSGAVLRGLVLSGLFLAPIGSTARDLDLGIFPSLEPERVAPTQPNGTSSRPAPPARPGAGAASPVQPAKSNESVVAPARRAEERLKRARSADGLFTLEAVDLPALKRLDPAITCYDGSCVTARASVLGYRGMTVCMSEVIISVKAGLVTGAACDISIATARDIHAALKDLLGAPATDQKMLSAHMSWKAERRAIQVVYWKGTNVKGVPYEKWSVQVGER